ncbi:MAG: ABC transporter ATP-binding protein [Tannerellaceae bacterium]|jgi:iron complex transport system ATP-binding protein|nr:ABC transporter ATP-binding protein [Tannerellaceae bacterium]
MRKAVIQTYGLCIGYGVRGRRPKVVLGDINVSLFTGEVTCLLGLNGAGKSTLLRTLCGFQAPISGSILLDGLSLRSYSQAELALMTGVVLTEKTGVGGITVDELVSLGRHPHTGFFGRLGKRDMEVVHRSTEAAGIAHKGSSYMAELSDGERQKAMIAKTLAQECPVIILDEPTAFLDVTGRIETMILLRKLSREQDKAILLSTHDIEQAIRMGDRIWLIGEGRRMECGAPEDLILGGAFDSFFGKEDMRFDLSTGRINAPASIRAVVVDGDLPVARWVGNALMRNGWQPKAVEGDTSRVAPLPYIRCVNSSDIILTLPSGEVRRAASVEELLAVMRTLQL